MESKSHTPNIAFLTRSELIRPLPARLLMSAALLEPEDLQAMVMPCEDELLKKRVKTALRPRVTRRKRKNRNDVFLIERVAVVERTNA